MDPLHARLRARLETGADPEEAPTQLDRFVEAAGALPGGLAGCVPDPQAEELLVRLFEQSRWLARALIREPERLAALAADPWLRREKPAAALRAECAAALATVDGVADPARALRRFRNQEYLRLGARELGFGAAGEVGRELCGLAEACLEGALAVAWAELAGRHGEPITDEGGRPHRCRFVVFGMGKLGGEELNFSSDIDLIYLYESDSGAAGGLTLHEFFSRLAERLSRLVAEPTVDGTCFRVDLRLRPEGTRGPLVNSLEAAEHYYEAWGRPWERQAWIKARAVAGDLDLGEAALRLLEPFVWPRIGSAGVIGEVQALMAKVRAELGDRDDVKLGPGGIREVEFIVQALQLVHGGRRRELRERGTLRALDRLLFAGLVSEREHRYLADAYVLLRRVEHRVQLEELRQTHAIPETVARRALLARRLGLADAETADETAALRLAGVLHRARRSVESIYRTLGLPPPGPSAEVETLLDPASARGAIERALGALGFRDAEASADEIELLRGKPRSPFAPSATGEPARAAPLLLAEAAASPDPDLALRRLVDLAVRGTAGATVWRLVAASPPLGRLLASLFGTSDFLAKIFVAHPELVESVLTSVAVREPGVGSLAAPPDGEEDERLDALCRARNEELLRIGLRDVAGALDVDEVCAALSALAERCIGAVLDLVMPAILRRWGRPGTSLVVVGLGKLGGAEMTYSSDLDLVFVFGDEDAPLVAGPEALPSARAGEVRAFEVMSRLAQRLISALGTFLPSGRLYEVDTRLRPSGQQGALVSSLAGFERYHSGQAALWERQALIKARTVAGDARLGEAVEGIARRHVWEGPPLDPERTAHEIGRLRARMERELARETAGRFNIKSGRGGLLDVEFLVQYLQLVHGPAHPEVRQRATRPALDALRSAGLLDAPTHARLADSYRFLRRLENRMRIVHDRSISQLPKEPRELEKLARRLGYYEASPGERLLADYREHTGEVRRIYARHLPVP